jgi:hypothetical protein
MSLKQREKIISEHFRRLADPVFARRSNVESMHTRYKTTDVIRMHSKLSNPDFKGLMLKADDLMTSENISLWEPSSPDWMNEVLYHIHYDPDIREDTEEFADRETEYERKRNVTQWREEFPEILKKYSWDRLDWLWDMSWSFYVSYRDQFRQGHLKVYKSILGNIPRGLEDIPFQSVLTAERKYRQRSFNEKMSKAILRKDTETLEQMGFTEDEISKAYERADHIQSRRG